MRKAAILDVVILLVIFWSIWALRFVEVGHSGALTVGVGGLVGIFLIRRRNIAWAEIGFRAPRRADLRLSFEAAGVVGLTYLAAPLIISVFGPMSPSSAITDQPTDLLGFLVDILIFTWLAAGLGEEFFFRGVLFHRLRDFLGGGVVAVIAAAGLQAVWFGAAHVSQGLSGMVLTGLMGFGLGLFFCFRAERSLFPLILAHAAINTAVLSFSYFG